MDPGGTPPSPLPMCNAIVWKSSSCDVNKVKVLMDPSLSRVNAALV